MNSSTPVMNVGENGFPLEIHDLSICCSKSMCRRVETVLGLLFESVSEYGVSGGLGGLKNT